MKTVSLTKSKILQMEYVGVPEDRDAEVLGWVSVNGKKCTLFKSSGCYYRGTYIEEVYREVGGVQFATDNGGWEFPHLTKVSYRPWGFMHPVNMVTNRDDEKNEELYEHLVAYKRKTEIAGQVYY